MTDNKTIIIYTLENGHYHSYITGLDLFISGNERNVNFKTFEECQKATLAELEACKEDIIVESTTAQLKRYFSDMDDEMVLTICKIDVINL